MKAILYWVDVSFFLFWATALAILGRWSLRYEIGMGMAAAAFVLWMTARFQLGASFSVRPKAKELVTHGLYSRFRNPIYLFGTLAFLGLAIAWGNPIGLVYVILSLPMQLLRLKKEAGVLEQAFGEQYRVYKARTWF